MTPPITFEYVDQRFATFVEKLKAAMTSLGHSSEKVAQYAEVLAHRLSTRDYKLYGHTALHHLQSGKRITRFYIKQAIETRPEQLLLREQLRERYCKQVAEARKANPLQHFFSFEAANANALKVPLAPFKKLFYL